MAILLNLVLSTLAVFVTAHLLPGVRLDGWFAALIVALVLGFVNAVIKPVLLVLTLPINILTLGLFTFVIIAACVMLASALVPGFKVDGFLWAMAFGVVLAIINSLFRFFTSVI